MRVFIKSNIALAGYRRCSGGGGRGDGAASSSLVAGALLVHALLSRESVTLLDIFMITICIQICFRVVAYNTVVDNTGCKTLM